MLKQKKKRKGKDKKAFVYGLVPSSIDISGGCSPASVVVGGCVGETVGDRFCRPRSLLMTPLLNCSSRLFGSHRSASEALAMELVARMPIGVLGIEGDSTLG